MSTLFFIILSLIIGMLFGHAQGKDSGYKNGQADAIYLMNLSLEELYKDDVVKGKITFEIAEKEGENKT